MERNRKNYFSLCLLGLAFGMLQLHIMAGCCFVHHCHAGEISPDCAYCVDVSQHEISQHEISWAVDVGFSNIALMGDCEVECHKDQLSHYCCNTSSCCDDEMDHCDISLLTDSSKQTVKITNLVLPLLLSSFVENISFTSGNSFFTADVLSVSLSGSPLYLRYRSFLI